MIEKRSGHRRVRVYVGRDREWTKNRSKRRVAVGPAVVELLRARRVEQAKAALATGVALAPDADVFSRAPDGSEPIRPDGVSHRFAELAKDLGISCRLHDLRHCAVARNREVEGSPS